MPNKREYKEIGKNIESGVREALFNGNWDSLNDAITKSVDTVLDGVGDKLNEKFYTENHKGAKPLSERKGVYSEGDRTREWEERLRNERASQRREIEAERARREAERVRRQQSREAARGVKKTELGFPFVRVGDVSSTLTIVGGGIGAGIVGAVLLKDVIKLLVVGTIASTSFIMPGLFGCLFAGLLTKGILSSKLTKKADRYAKLIGNKGYIEIKNLALLTNQKPKMVVRDLKKMLKKGFFPEGHLDEKNTTFILTDAMFHQYLETKDNYDKGGSGNIIDSTAREVDSEFPNLSPEDAAELRQMISSGHTYISKVKELNDIIPGEEVSSKLDRLEGLLNEIFARVKEHPEQMSKMHELMDYYLPTVIKIVEAYSEYDDVSEPGAEIVKAKSDIENTLDTINGALSKLLNNLFKDSVWDVTTDAQVLKTVLAQKGLSEDK